MKVHKIEQEITFTMLRRADLRILRGGGRSGQELFKAGGRVQDRGNLPIGPTDKQKNLGGGGGGGNPPTPYPPWQAVST